MWIILLQKSMARSSGIDRTFMPYVNRYDQYSLKPKLEIRHVKCPDFYHRARVTGICLLITDSLH